MYGNLKQGLAARKGVTPIGCKINFVAPKRSRAGIFFFLKIFLNFLRYWPKTAISGVISELYSKSSSCWMFSFKVLRAVDRLNWIMCKLKKKSFPAPLMVWGSPNFHGLTLWSKPNFSKNFSLFWGGTWKLGNYFLFYKNRYSDSKGKKG